MTEAEKINHWSTEKPQQLYNRPLWHTNVRPQLQLKTHMLWKQGCLQANEVQAELDSNTCSATVMETVEDCWTSLTTVSVQVSVVPLSWC